MAGAAKEMKKAFQDYRYSLDMVISVIVSASQDGDGNSDRLYKSVLKISQGCVKAKYVTVAVQAKL